MVLALTWYEHLLTFNLEVREIWHRKFSWLSLLFFVNRYLLLANTPIVVLMQFRWPGISDKVSSQRRDARAY